MLNASASVQTDVMPPKAIFWGLQPAIFVLVYCCAAGLIPFVDTLGGLLLALLILTAAEEIWPARHAWKQTGAERLGCMAMFALSVVAMAVWQEWLYPLILHEPLSNVRSAMAPFWPRTHPVPIQTFLAFLILSFIAYWLHRFQHKIGILWRTTGHGVHHTYKRLNAINWNANHPLEAISLVAPAAVLNALFDVGSPTEIAAAIAIISTACAHMNVRVNIQGIGLLFTSNVHHVHHHSSIYQESNTNYGCASTLWDRVFGTFEHADTVELGDFEIEPTLIGKLAHPLKSI
jgi:sterol desaturase/sphingolipid hydroxylase (fatty acid hydroxylase superfamily)